MINCNMNSVDMPDQPHSLIVRVVSSVLGKLISGHGDSPRRGFYSDCSFLKFESSYAPDVTIESYLERIRKYSRCSDACFVMSLVYVDRLIEAKQLVLTPLNVHRLLVTSVMLAAKFHDDLFYNNAYYSKLGGLSLYELNHLESELLHLLDFSLFVKETAYGKYSKQLQNYVFYLDVFPVLQPVLYGGCGESPSHRHHYRDPSSAPQQIHQQPLSLMNPHSIFQQQSYGLAAAATAATPMDMDMQNRHGHGVYYDRDYTTIEPTSLATEPYCGDVPRIPSPYNLHARPWCGNRSKHSLASNSPLRLAPSSSSAPTPNMQQQQQQQQHPDHSHFPACGVGGAAGGMSSVMMGGYLQSYVASTLRDSADDSTTTSCSTRTTSPYPAALVYARNNSAGALGLQMGVPGLSAIGTQPALGNGGSAGTPSVHCSPLPSVVQARCQQRTAPSSGGLSIQTDYSTLGLETAYPLQRNDSNGSVCSISTPSSVYQPPPQQYVFPPQQQQQGAQAYRGNHYSYEHQLSVYHQQLLHYQQATAAQPSPLGAYAKTSLSHCYQQQQQQQQQASAQQASVQDSSSGCEWQGGAAAYSDSPSMCLSAVVTPPRSQYSVPPLQPYALLAQAHAQQQQQQQQVALEQQQHKVDMWRYAHAHAYAAASAVHQAGMGSVGSDHLSYSNQHGRSGSAYCSANVM